MAGSSPGPNDAQRRDSEDSRQFGRRSRTPEDLGRGRVKFPGKAEHRGREFVRDPKSGTALPPHFPSSHNHPRRPSPGHHRQYQDSRNRRSSQSRTSKEALDEGQPAARRTKRSSEHTSQYSHGNQNPSTSYKRRHSRSSSPSTALHKHRKRRRSISPTAPSSRGEYHHSRESRDQEAGSPRPAPVDDSAAGRRPPSDIHSASHRRHRSRSVDRGEASRLGRPQSRADYPTRDADKRYHSNRRQSPKRPGKRAFTRSPPPPRGPRSQREENKREARVEEHRRGARDHRLSGPGREPYSESRDQRSPSPTARKPRRESRERLPRRSNNAAPRGDHESQRRRSLSRESQRPFKHEKDRDADMYNRPTYDARYGGYPPSHNPHGHHSYPSSSYGSHAGSPVHGYPSQQSPYPYQQSSSQPGVPYYQPQPGKQYGGSPNHPVYQSARDSIPRAPQRGPAISRGTGRGHFQNLSWTPNDGTRGGTHVQPTDKDKSREGSVSAVSKPLAADRAVDPEDDDNPFRPPADLRAEDESARKKRKMSIPEKTATPTSVIVKTEVDKGKADLENAKNKISFSIKGRAAAAAAEKALPVAPKPQTSPDLSKKAPVPVSPLVQNTVPKSTNYVGNTRVETRKPSPPPMRKEKVMKKRLKTRPELSEEFSQSDSVYFRKTGNESVVGSGTYGKVYRAVHVYTKGMVALKKIRMEGERDGFPVTAIREIKLLQSLNHLNIVALQEVMVERNDCFMVFEYLSHDLTGLLNHPSFALTDAHKKHLAKQLFEGLDYLHRRGVLHRDIKAANILISKTGELKLADFGLARFYQKSQKQDYTNRVITIWYRSPELLLGETQYGPAVDIWSAACVLVEIFTRHAIFPGDGGEINQLDKIYNVLGTPSRSEWPGITELQWYELLRPNHRIPSTLAEKYKDRVSPEAFELLQAMFLYDPAARPTAADVLEHPYFNTEEPQPQQVFELENLDGDWHEFESKALRKEKERQERDTRRRDRESKDGEKRKGDELVATEPKRTKTSEAAV